MLNNDIINKINKVRILLKISYTVLFLVAGIDKIFNFTTAWGQYVNPKIYHFLGLNYFQFIFAVFVIETVLGLLALTKTSVAAYGMAIWFLLIVINLLSMFNYFDIAARDLVLASGAIALAKLTEIKNQIHRQ